MITNFSGYAQTLCRSQASKIVGLDFKNYSTFFQLVFGINAIQTATLLKIKKADLLELQATANNSVQSLFVVLLLRMFAFNNINNSKLNIYKWGSSISGNILTHTLLFDLFNQITLTDLGELPPITTTVNPGDY